jgi:GT2 family glycosyltransferase
VSEHSVDLVLTTSERTNEPARLLDALAQQSFRDFRLIVTDQSGDGRIAQLLAPHAGSLEILHLPVNSRGLSRARNAALEHVSADIVALADDDCWYPADFLERLVATFAARPACGGITGRTVDEHGEPSGLRWDRAPGPLTRRNVFRRAIGPAIFLRRDVVDIVGPFDESLGRGAGTPWGSGEDTDYLLRAIAAGFEIRYDPSLAVYHPGPAPRFGDAAARAKAYEYGAGHTELLRRHGYPRAYAAWRALALVGAAALFFAKGRPGLGRYYWAMARGRTRELLRAA